jgi:Tn3 transposase DDE domain
MCSGDETVQNLGGPTLLCGADGEPIARPCHGRMPAQRALADADLVHLDSVISPGQFRQDLLLISFLVCCHRGPSVAPPRVWTVSNLLVTAIILWNTRYLGRAIAALREVEEVPDAPLAHLSPLGWEHVNLTGDYVWATADEVSETRDGLRPVRAGARLAA